MESLTENLISNLPEGCVIRQHPQGPSDNECPVEAVAGIEGQVAYTEDRSSPDGWDIPQSVVEVAAQELPLELRLDGNPDPAHSSEPAMSPESRSQSASLRLQQAEGPGSIPGSFESRQEASKPRHEPTHGIQQACQQSCQTRVVPAMLDWRDKICHLKPPYDLLLVADVVSLTAFALRFTMQQADGMQVLPHPLLQTL